MLPPFVNFYDNGEGSPFFRKKSLSYFHPAVLFPLHVPLGTLPLLSV